ncbi:MAG: IS200/IS605 family transposase [Firmicutes bacterium]|nr:IS200/IS605 family transposase [Bacillota bacterium]
MVLSSDGYYRNRHSCFLLQYHLVLITKYRHPVITGWIEEDLKTYTREFFSKKDMNIVELECMPDHVHILFEAQPQINLADFVNSFKTCSSRRIRQRYGGLLSKYYWKPYFWSQTYFLGSVSEKSTEVVKRYIQNQKGDK